MTYKNRELIKHKSLRYLDTEDRLERCQQAAEAVDMETQPFIRSVVRMAVRMVERSQVAPPKQRYIPKRKEDFIEVDPAGRISFSEQFRLCRAA